MESGCRRGPEQQSGVRVQEIESPAAGNSGTMPRKAAAAAAEERPSDGTMRGRMANMMARNFGGPQK